MKLNLSLLSGTVMCLLLCACSKHTVELSPGENPPVDDVSGKPGISVPLGGNAYITTLAPGGVEVITNNGLGNWTSAASIASVYFRLGQTGQLNVSIKAKVPSGASTVKITVNGTAFSKTISGTSYKAFSIGSVNINTIGYVKVDLQGESKSGNYFADVSDIIISGSATTANVVLANDPQNFYWSRRGPSCHLGYTTPSGDKEYFYSELTVPAGEDKIGSYFMANGFGEGYMGIQVNSASERRVLFSVWDPVSGQTTLVKKGADVTAGRFGGEGTGGQSYLVYNWQAGATYKFLTQGKPDDTGSTVYTAWFFAPEVGSWKLIASWTRPNTSKYMTGFHGFLENFNPDYGYQGRKAYWNNQWVRLASGTWSEVTEFKFTVDATGTNKQRLDYAGGVENGKFFLQMDGFFANNVTTNTLFTKSASGIAPTIDFANLP